LASISDELQVALGAVDFPEQVRAARLPATIVDLRVLFAPLR
jgi:hypothetical protein